MFDCVFLKGREQCFCSSYRPKSSNCFPVKTYVFERSFIFYTSVCKHGALHLRLHVVALPGPDCKLNFLVTIITKAELIFLKQLWFRVDQP